MGNNNNQDWDITSPADTDKRSDGAKEIRVLRDAVGVRMSKEHRTLATDTSSDDAGGEHKAGSAFAYIDDGAVGPPAFRPDGVTSLNDKDEGRIWIDFTSTGTQYQAYIWVWDSVTKAGTWTPIVAVNASGALPDAFVQFTGMDAKDTQSPIVTVDFEPRHVVMYLSVLSNKRGYFGEFILPTPITTEQLFYARITRGKDSNFDVELSVTKNDDPVNDKWDLKTSIVSNYNAEYASPWDAHIIGTNS